MRGSPGLAQFGDIAEAMIVGDEVQGMECGVYDLRKGVERH